MQGCTSRRCCCGRCSIAVSGQRLLQQRTLASTEADLTAIQQESERLEDELRRFDPTSRVLSSSAASAIADLEDGIAVIDERLGQPETGLPGTELIDLWRHEGWRYIADAVRACAASLSDTLTLIGALPTPTLT